MDADAEARHTNEALNRVVRDYVLLCAGVGLPRKFFFASIPTEFAQCRDTFIRTDCSHDPKALACVLRAAADFYDPPRPS